MRKILTVLLFVAGLTLSSFASVTDSTATVVDTSNHSMFSSDKLYAELTLASRNVFRGVSYSESPSIQPMMKWMPCKYAELGVYGFTTFTGERAGYGNQINAYITLKPFASSKSELKNISLTSDDYYYYNVSGNNNGYFAWSTEKTLHFVEARLKYDARFDFGVDYVYLANKNAKVDGIYFEAGYDLSESLNIFAGYLTDRNDLMFTNKGGWNAIGASISKKLNVCHQTSLLKVSVVANPNYENVVDLPGVGNGPVHLVGSITF